MSARAAIVLIGPTGAGKSPLGDALEAGGLAGRTVAHFDFGAQLRALAARAPDDAFTSKDIAFVRNVLERGVLLEDRHFPLAARILEAFVHVRGLTAADLLLMNGLPRHDGQARALDERLTWRAVVELACPAAVVYERLRRNSGGDRSERNDDTPERVRKRLETYAKRTAPLLDWFSDRGVPLIRVSVGVEDTGTALAAKLREVWS